MISIVKGLARFDGRAAFSTWSYRIATNAALDELRRRRRRPSLHVTPPDDAPAPEPVDPLSHRRVDAVADRLALDAALAELPDEFRVAVVLRDVGDLDYAEIADGARRPGGHRQVADRTRPGDADDQAREPGRPARTSNVLPTPILNATAHERRRSRTGRCRRRRARHRRGAGARRRRRRAPRERRTCACAVGPHARRARRRRTRHGRPRSPRRCPRSTSAAPRPAPPGPRRRRTSCRSPLASGCAGSVPPPPRRRS